MRKSFFGKHFGKFFGKFFKFQEESLAIQGEVKLSMVTPMKVKIKTSQGSNALLEVTPGLARVRINTSGGD